MQQNLNFGLLDSTDTVGTTGATTGINEQNNNTPLLQGTDFQHQLQNSFEQQIQKRIETLIRPYRAYILPLLALFSLGLVQFLNVLVYWTFAVTIKPLFYIAKSTGFIKITTVPAEKEVVSL